MIGLQAPLWRRGLIEQSLEDPARDANDALVLADPDPEFDGSALLVPAGVRRKPKKHLDLRKRTFLFALRSIPARFACRGRKWCRSTRPGSRIWVRGTS